MLTWLVVAAGVLLVAGEDDRCFLTGGGSTEIFFVLEDEPVGSVLGQLSVTGDVGKDISLMLDDAQNLPVNIDTRNGSAVLVLTAPLDKEGLKGPSGITVEVICERLGTDDPGLAIPVNIR